MARKLKSLNCILLVLHVIMMIVALVVLIISSNALTELMDKKRFMEGSEVSKDVVNKDREDLAPDLMEKNVDNPPARSEERVPQGAMLGPAIMLVASVVATLLLSAYAFYSTIRMNIHLLSAFIFLMTLALIAQLGASIWALAVRGRSMEYIRVTLIHHLDEYEVGVKPGESAMAHPWDALQRQMECCGVDGPRDYFIKGAIPLSCCASAGYTLTDKPRGDNTGPSPPVQLNATQTPFACHSFRQNGCLESLAEYVKKRFLLIGVFGIIATFMEVIVLMVTIAYTASTKRDLISGYV